MYRIRMHGRGGQGIKTASRILGSALFAEGFEVQDAPRYGAERRGAPMYATVRAGHTPIHERGAITNPDLVVVADDTLIPIAGAGVMVGVDDHSVLLLRSETGAGAWQERLKLAGPVHVLPVRSDPSPALQHAGAACVGASARLLGVISAAALESAIHEELGGLAVALLAQSLAAARASYDAFASLEGCVTPRADLMASTAQPPDWVRLPFEPADVAAPDIHGAATSVEVRTGLWRTMRPVIDLDHCRRCHWLCSSLCPDGVIDVAGDGTPRIDYEHCKGCMVCVAVCPPHAIRAVPELQALAEEAETTT